MVEGIDIIGLNLPLYIILPLLFSYLIWSKFIKKGQLKPKKVDDLLDIFSLFIFIFVSFMSFSVTLLFIISSLWKEPIPQLLKFSTYLVIGLASLGIISFINQYRDKKDLSKRYLQKIILEILQFSTILLASFLGLLLVILITALRISFGYMPYFLIFIILLIVICYFVISGFLGKNWKTVLKEIFNRKYLTRCVPFFIIFSAILFSLLIPIIKYEDVKKIEYHIYDSPDNEIGRVYLKVQGLIDILTFGIFSDATLVHITSLPVHYGRYGIGTDGESGRNFRLWLNISDENVLQLLVDSFESVRNFKEKITEKHSFENADLDEAKGLINLKFDVKNIKKERIKKIIIEGYVQKNMTELNYVYYDNSDRNDVCYGNICNLVFNITNDLDLPIIFKEKEITILNVINKGIDGQSICKFVNVTSNFPIDEEGKRMIIHSCDGDSCDLELMDTTAEDEFKWFFDMGLHIEDNTVIRLHKLEIKKPVNVEAQFQISCLKSNVL